MRKKVVYEIPKNGILLTSSKMEVGIVKRTFYTVDSLGRRSLLKIFSDDNFHGNKAEWGFFMMELLEFMETQMIKNLWIIKSS